MLQHCFEAIQVSISVNADPLDMAMIFSYLVRTVAYKNSEWAALYQNIWKARRQLDMVGKVLLNIGATVWAGDMLYKAVVWSLLFFGSESWVMTGAMLNVLEGFHH